MTAMMGMRGRVRRGVVAAGALLVAVWVASAEETNVTARLAELERQVAVLAADAERARFGDVFVKPGESVHGMGPAASKVYNSASGVTIGGYGEALYQQFDGEKDAQADFLRFVLYFGHKFNEKWVFNSELEVEHASTDKEGDASVEFAYIDYLWAPALNARAGLVLVPVGLLTELHEPTIFLGARRPDTESRIIPSTWRENGAGIFGDLGPLHYKAYVITALKGEDFAPNGLRGGRQKGSEAVAEDLAGVVRVDVDAMPGVMLGGSAYHGDSGQNLDVEASTTILEGHADLHRGPVLLRALGAVATVDDVAELNRLLAEPDDAGERPADGDINSIGEQLVGWYVEAGLDVAALAGASQLAVIPFVRYEAYNTQDEVPDGFAATAANDVTVTTVGVNVKPIEELVFKADYQFYDNEADTGIDQFNLAMGYVF
jgi:hypothetical protein